MLYWLGATLEQFYGPFRLLTSYLFLGGLGLVSGWLLTMWLLPKLTFLTPRDRGRAFAVDAKAAQGKPTGTGVIFISIFLGIQLIVLPFHFEALGVALMTFVAMLTGYFDDKSDNPWSEYTKGALDLVLSLVTAAILCGFSSYEIWLPLTKMTLDVPPLIFIPLASVLIWFAINATNCTDGVDGLSGTLSVIALASLGVMMFSILGHKDVSAHLLLPHYQDGAVWGIMAFSMVGCVVGYLWYNAHPSQMMMGDAGSRALGFLIGVFVIMTGNPFIIFIVSGVLLINGGTGLIKLALLRFLKVAIFKTVRFPLHDHVRHNLKWSNTQVLVRFSILQGMLTLILIVVLIKIR